MGNILDMTQAAPTVTMTSGRARTAKSELTVDWWSLTRASTSV